MTISTSPRLTVFALSCLALANAWQLFLATPRCIAGEEAAPADVESVQRGAAAKGKAGVPDATDPASLESWRVIYIGNTRAGYAHSFTEQRQRDGRTVIFNEVETVMAIVRFQQTIRISTILRIEETPSGDLLKYQLDLHNPPAAISRSSGVVRGNVLQLETEIAGKVTRREIAWDGSAKSPAYPERLLRERPLKPGEKRTARIFDPEFNSEQTLTQAAEEYETVKLLDGSSPQLLKVGTTSSATPKIIIVDYLDAHGESWKSTINLQQMAHYKVSREVALAKLTGAEADLGVGTMIQVAPIRNSLTARRAVYRIRIPGDDPSGLISTGATQQVRKTGADVAELTVTALTAPRAGDAAVPADVARKYLPPTEFIQSDDAQVRQHATRAVGAEADPFKACVLMERYVFENLKKKNFSTLLASAAEVAQSMSGDCTEHGVLLAAMFRARGIPSRVAVGLVYVPRHSSFGYHLWTEGYVRGTWIPFDATLGRGGIAADHIKILDSNLADSGPAPVKDFIPLISVLGKTEIEVLKVEY